MWGCLGTAATARLREAGCSAGSQPLFGPPWVLWLLLLLRPVFSLPGLTGCRWETLTHFFEGNAVKQCGGSPQAPRRCFPDGTVGAAAGSLQAGLQGIYVHQWI